MTKTPDPKNSPPAEGAEEVTHSSRRTRPLVPGAEDDGGRGGGRVSMQVDQFQVGHGTGYTHGGLQGPVVAEGLVKEGGLEREK